MHALNKGFIRFTLGKCWNDRKNSAGTYLNEVDAIVVPGGFGNRGVNGKISAIKFARENRFRFLGLCLWYCMLQL